MGSPADKSLRIRLNRAGLQRLSAVCPHYSKIPESLSMLKSDKPSGTGSADFVKTQTFLRPLKYRDIRPSQYGSLSVSLPGCW